MKHSLTDIIGNYSATENIMKQPFPPSDFGLTKAKANKSFPYSTINKPFVFNVYFDGGGSYDFSYGSFEIEFNGFKVNRHRMPFRSYNIDGIKVTSNVAEYLSLICALRWLEKVKDKQQYLVNMWGDSKLVTSQVSGGYRCNKPHLAVLRGICRNILKDFGDWRIYWHSRRNSVARFGH